MNELILAILLASSDPSADERCMRAAVYKEAGNQSLKGMKAVRQTIRNRARRTGKSWCSTIKEPKQFSFYRPGTKLADVRIDKKWLHRYRKASIMPDVLSRDHLFFHHKDIKPKWAGRMKCRKIDDHMYCKFDKEKKWN